MAEQERDPVTNCVTERRIGRFSVTAELLDAIPNDGLAALFANFAIIRAEHLFSSNTFEYVAYSPLFGVACAGEMIPQYKIQTTITDGATTVVAHPWTSATWAEFQAANQAAKDDIAAFVGGTRE